MSELLIHYGVKGMKWGIRRTPEQLGHVVARKRTGSKNYKSSAAGRNKSKASDNRYSSLSDDEIRMRINRLNLEEQYDNLLARQKARSNTGFKSTAKRLLGNAAEDFGKQLLSKAVSNLVERIAGDKKFDIKDYQNMDVNDMDAESIAKVSKWYTDALKIDSSRSKLRADEADSSGKAKETTSDTHSGKSADTTLRDKSSDSSPAGKSAESSERIPWIYREAGSAYQKEAQRIARDRRNRDKDVLKWLI